MTPFRGHFIGWVKARVGGVVIRMAARQAQRHRGAVTDASFAAMGDILLYQAHGDAIRDFIRDRITSAPAPRVVVAHSLGGIACVDLFVKTLVDIRLLVTVGSQAPFLYEIGALSSLRHDEPLPPHFPKWLNIYDLRDLLSYIGAKVFAGRVTDVEVNNRQPFPQAHSAYWMNPEVWGTLAKALA